MVTQEMIDRINTLYHKSQATGLTEEEKAEQAELRKKYVEAIRTSMRSNLNNISIKEKDGTITDLGKKYGGVKGSSYEAGRDWQPGKRSIQSVKQSGIYTEK